MQVRVKEFDLESMKNSLGDNTVELPEEIKVHWQSFSDHWDFTIKYISAYGAGFPRRWDGCKYVSINERTKCTMPDGTEIENNDNMKFISDIVAWVKSNSMKLEVSQEIEFMDI